LLELSGDVDGLPADLSERFSVYLDETYRVAPRTPRRAPGRRSRTTVHRPRSR